MVFIIIPRVRRVVVYFCPKCRQRARFFSWLPVLKPEWRCRGCAKKFKMNASCVGTNWSYVFGLWSIPLTWLATGGVLVVAAVHTAATAPAAVQTPLPKLVLGLLGGFFCLGPVMGVVLAPLFMVLGYFVGLIYGACVVK